MQIILAFFILAIGIGAWKAWRSSPVYSLRSTLKAVTVLLLGLALAIGLVLPIANHLPSRSPLVVALFCLALVMAITLGLCAAFIRITDGRAAKAPTGTKPVDRHRRKLYPWLLGSGIVLVLLLAWAAVVAPSSAELPLTFALLVVAIGVPLLGSLYIQARRTDYATAALMVNYWVHWQHPSGKDEAWLGPDGLLCGGEYTPWLASGNYLVKACANWVPPASLVLTFERLAGGYRGAPTAIRVLIPEGRESDVELLREKLRARCPKAHIG
jgi:hypothetical protein